VALRQTLEWVPAVDFGAGVLGDAPLAADQVALAVEAGGEDGVADRHYEEVSLNDVNVPVTGQRRPADDRSRRLRRPPTGRGRPDGLSP
jgi:hypothetical protein